MKVCASCFSDIELQRFITSNSFEIGKCNYCNNGSRTKLLDIKELLDFFSEFLDIFVERKDGEPLIDLVKKDWNLFSENVIGYDILSDILSIATTSFSNPNIKVNYIDEIIDCTSYWETLKEDLKWNRRFLTDIAEILELGWDSFFNKQLELAPDEFLYRGRIHKISGLKAYAIDKMGSPEKENVTGGRANPQGIPYLYLSKSPDTILYETRSTFLDEISIGTFKIKKNKHIVLVDFTEEMSAFNNIDNISEYTKSVMLKQLISSDLSKPIRRYDSKLEYVPTQFICEFIRNITDADGILFNSALHEGGINIVLFEQEKVECVSVNKHRVTLVNINSKIV